MLVKVLHKHNWRAIGGLGIGGLLLWTTHYLRGRREITPVMKWIDQRFNGLRLGSPPAASFGDATIVSKIRVVISAVKSVHSVGYASLLASVLEKICEGGVTSQV
jgi:hypothetical protein